MQKLSVVIVCKDEAEIIGRTLDSLHGLTDDIVVYDNGSTDETMTIARDKGARVFTGEWKGYGVTKKVATALARNDWILSLDADESVSEKLRNEILSLDLSDEKVVYVLKFRNYLGNKAIRFGEWGGDRHERLFNRMKVGWNESPVHESLIIPDDVTLKSLDGYILHYTARSVDEYEKKLERYAVLNAKKYEMQGRKASWFRRFFSAPFSFINNYIFRLGFLDGREGFQCARISARYTYLKYAKLKELGAD